MMERTLNIYFAKLNSQFENCLLVFDDSCEKIFNEEEFSKLATAGRQKKICFNRVNCLEQLILTQYTSFR